VGWLIPKTYLRWREPYDLYRAREVLAWRALPRFFRPTAAVVMSLLLLFGWALAPLNPKNDPPTLECALGLALFFGPFMIYILPLLSLLEPSIIRVTETCIRCGSVRWGYSDVTSCRIIMDGEAEHALTVLEINTRNGKRHFLGIAPAVSVDELLRVLEERGVAVSREVTAADEPALLARDKP
jgi:hypothetical protein